MYPMVPVSTKTHMINGPMHANMEREQSTCIPGQGVWAWSWGLGVGLGTSSSSRGRETGSHLMQSLRHGCSSGQVLQGLAWR